MAKKGTPAKNEKAGELSSDPLKRRTLLINIAPTKDMLTRKTPPPEGAQSKPRPQDTYKVLKVEGGTKYRLGPIVAEGGMGVVQEAEDLRCQRVVAMKTLPKGAKVPEEDEARFISEAQITSQLEHPNIVPVHELGYDVDRNVYYTMKYVKGMTLTDILMAIRHGDQDVIDEYSLSRLLNIFQKVCDAVAFSHSKGIIHCDLKPDNVMVCDFGEVVVMDWGLARPIQEGAELSGVVGKEAIEAALEDVVGDEGDAAANAESDAKMPTGSVSMRTTAAVTKTTTGRVMGTPGFMAPERIVDDLGIDERSDIYSLGATLYSILTLRAPVGGSNTREMLRAILKGEFPSPVAFNDPENLRKSGKKRGKVRLKHCPDEQVPAALSEIVMKALATDPVGRFQTVQDLQKEIEAYQNGLIWHLVIDEDFSEPDIESRWEIIGGEWQVEDGELRIQGGEPQLLILKQELPGDVRIDYEARQESVYVNDLSCFMSALDSENRKEIPYSGYEFKLGGHDNSLSMLVRSDRRLWSESASPLVRGETYRVRAERIGARLRMVVNDEELFHVTDPDPLSGAGRTAVGLFGWIADTRISRVRVYSLGVPWKLDILDLAERQGQKGNYVIAMAMYREVMDSLPDATRMARAERGYSTAQRCKEMEERLPELKVKLEVAWPDVPIQFGMDNDGLTLDIGNSGIDDLEALRGLPLKTLACANNNITSLEPLRGMNLSTLNCSGNPISSLEPLAGMSISTLVCEYCRIESFVPLRGMPLTMLVAGGNRFGTLEPLRGMKITNLSIWGSEVEDLEPLRGMQLSVLYCDGNGIRSLEPLKDSLLVMLNCAGNDIADLEPLRGMPLNVLHCGQNHLKSFEPLRGIALNMLTCTGNKVDSLEPLRGMPLGVLTCGENKLVGLGPFLDKPPEDFLFDCPTLPIEELERAREIWSKLERYEHLAGYVDVLLALRRDEEDKLFDMASKFRGHRYLFVPKFLRWDEAKEFCERVGGHLVTITSEEENEYLISMFRTGCWAWMGLTVGEHGGEWVTGEPYVYSNFVESLQGRRYGHKVFSKRWASDDSPVSQNTFIVEWDR